MSRWTIHANDGDGDGTTYFLCRDGVPIAAHAWPATLEVVAGRMGAHRVERTASNIGDAPLQAHGLSGWYRFEELPDPAEEAERWLRELLADGAMSWREVQRHARGARMVGRMAAASRALGVEKRRVWPGRKFVTGGGYQARKGSFWTWCLPGQWRGWHDNDDGRSVMDSLEGEVVEETEILDISDDEIDVAIAIDTNPVEKLKDAYRRAGKDVGDGVTTCKVDGCENVAVGKGSFSGLCEEHKTEEARRRNAKGQKSAKKRARPLQVDEPKPTEVRTQLVKLEFDDVLEQLVFAREQVVRLETQLSETQAECLRLSDRLAELGHDLFT